MALNDVSIVTGTVSPVNLQPASGESWKIQQVGSTVFTGSSAKVEVPSMKVALTDGTNVSYVRDGANGHFQFLRPLDLFVNNSVYARLEMASGTVAASYTTVATAAGLGEAKCALSSIADDAYMTIQPSSGQEWMLTEVASTEWTNNNPRIQLFAYNGTTNVLTRAFVVNASGVTDFGRKLRMHLTNSLYARIQNKSGSTQYVGYSALRTK